MISCSRDEGRLSNYRCRTAGPNWFEPESGVWSRALQTWPYSAVSVDVRGGFTPSTVALMLKVLGDDGSV